MTRTSFTLCFVLLVALAGNVAGQDLRLTVDRSSGAVGVENIGTAAVAMKGYTIGSEGQHLNPDNWTSLADAGLPGWLEANPSTSFLSELNRQSESALNAGDSVNLGNAYVPGPQKGDVFFEYITSDLDVFSSMVHYTGPVNDLAIYIDPITGEASMANLSPFIDAPTIKGYSILSPSGGLTDSGWTSLASTGSGGEGWVEANPSANHLSELNRDNSATLENNTIFPLGMIIAAGSDTRDLVFEYFTVASNVLTGSVEYIPLPGTLVGDCNGDGIVDAADLACACQNGVLDDVLAATNLVKGDLDGVGGVAFSDFLTLSTNFGMEVDGYTDGDVDCNGTVGFADFLMLSANFGQGAGEVAASVPEPSGTMLLGLGSLLMGLIRRRR